MLQRLMDFEVGAEALERRWCRALYCRDSWSNRRLDRPMKVGREVLLVARRPGFVSPLDRLQDGRTSRELYAFAVKGGPLRVHFEWRLNRRL